MLLILLPHFKWRLSKIKIGGILRTILKGVIKIGGITVLVSCTAVIIHQLKKDVLSIISVDKQGADKFFQPLELLFFQLKATEHDWGEPVSFDRRKFIQTKR